jgi:hypothetical protein
LRVVVVPLNTPDTVSDPKTFFAGAADAAAAQMQVTVAARTAGLSEVRLYSVPPSGSNYTVAVRVPITITPATK